MKKNLLTSLRLAVGIMLVLIMSAVCVNAQNAISFSSPMKNVTLPEAIPASFGELVTLPKCQSPNDNLTFVGYTDYEVSVSPLSEQYLYTGNVTLYPLFKNKKGEISTNFDQNAKPIFFKGEYYFESKDGYEITEDYGSLTLTLKGGYPTSSYAFVFSSNKIVIESINDKEITIRGLCDGEVTLNARRMIDEKSVASVVIKISNQTPKKAVRDTKLMLFGNSILNHSPLPSNNWFGSWGMAATSAQTDYKYRLGSFYMPTLYGSTQYERGGQHFEATLQSITPDKVSTHNFSSSYASMVDDIKTYGADIAVFQVGDNVSNYDLENYQTALEKLVDEIRKECPDTDIVLVAPYYNSAVYYQATKNAANNKGTMFVNLNAILSNPEYQGGNDGTGSTEQGGFTGGVRTHPGDKGMEVIALRMLSQIQTVMGKHPIEIQPLDIEQLPVNPIVPENNQSDEIKSTYDKSSYSFSFEEQNNLCGFTSYNLFHFKVQDGCLYGTATDVATTGADMKFISPELDIDNKGALVIKMRHESFNENTKVKAVINGKHEFELAVTSSEMTNYIFDISSVNEKITLLEIYAANLDTTMNISYIGFTDHNNAKYVFENTNTYKEETFKDITDDKWYAKDVKQAYALGFMNGTSNDTFSPDGTVTLAQAITVACRINEVIAGKALSIDQNLQVWYTPYVNEAISRGIIKEGRFEDFNAPAKRSEVIEILCGAINSEMLTVINDFNVIPDVDSNKEYAACALSLYKAGILTGSDSQRNLKPDNNIKRSELCAVINRIARIENRVKF